MWFDSKRDNRNTINLTHEGTELLQLSGWKQIEIKWNLRGSVGQSTKIIWFDVFFLLLLFLTKGSKGSCRLFLKSIQFQTPTMLTTKKKKKTTCISMTFVIQVKLNSSKFSAKGVTATKKQSLASIVEISTIDENLFNWTLGILCWGERNLHLSLCASLIRW